MAWSPRCGLGLPPDKKNHCAWNLLNSLQNNSKRNGKNNYEKKNKMADLPRQVYVINLNQDHWYDGWSSAPTDADTSRVHTKRRPTRRRRLIKLDFATCNVVGLKDYTSQWLVASWITIAHL